MKSANLNDFKQYCMEKGANEHQNNCLSDNLYFYYYTVNNNNDATCVKLYDK